jgi:hypothetical protein
MLALAFAACTAIPATAPAQEPFPHLVAGTALTGMLEPGDASFNQRGRFRVYTFDARADERFTFDMRSSDFDAFLSVARPVGPLTDILATDDDGGEGTDARLRFRAPADGRYFLIAQSLSTDGTGSFRLAMERLPEAPPARPRPIALGAQVTGTLGEQSPLLDDDRRFDLYTFQGRAGQRVVITMRSSDFDSYLYLLAPGGDETILATDDDSGGGLDARIRSTLPSNGEFRIRAASLGSWAEGAYVLEVRENDQLPTAPRPILPGQTVEGALADFDEQLDRGAFVHQWTYSARAGERLRISMSSHDFDTYLIFGRMVNGVFEAIAEDDDGGDGTDSLIETTVAQAGQYVIRALSFSQGRTGTYTLRLERH